MDIVLIIILSILFAVSMKIADNLNEHGFKWFKGSNILFGILWGVIGSLLISQNNILANVWIAALIGWILRGKEDRINHGIASAIILLTFIFRLHSFKFDSILFITFFIGMVVSGLIHDYLSNKKFIKDIYSELFHSLLYYTLIPLIYAIFTKEWVVFMSLFPFVIAYEITRFYFNQRVKGIVWQ